MDINKILKVLFIISATWFLITVTSVPKTDCEACAIEYEGDVIDGVEAYSIFEKGCISYANPWDKQDPVNITFNWE